MTVLATYQKVQSINAGSSGIVSAPTAMPSVLSPVDLPCALTFPGPAVWNEHAVGLHRQERTYAVRVYVKPVSEGKGVDEGFQAVMPIMQALAHTYMGNPTLDNTVDHVGSGDRTWVEDAGVQVLEFAGVAYHGFELKIPIIEKGT